MPSPLDQHRGSFDALIDHGDDPAAAGCTYEWHCHRCDTRTWTSRVGGNLNPGTCKPHRKGEDLHVHVMLAGERWTLGTAASICEGTAH